MLHLSRVSHLRSDTRGESQTDGMHLSVRYASATHLVAAAAGGRRAMAAGMAGQADALRPYRIWTLLTIAVDHRS